MKFDWKLTRNLPAMEEIKVSMMTNFVLTFQVFPNVANEIRKSLIELDKIVDLMRKCVIPSFETQWPHREI